MMIQTSSFRHPLCGLLIAGLTALGSGCAKEPAGNAATTADLALKGGAIYTVDGARSWAQAVAIRDGRITFVGTDKDLEACIGIATGGWSRSPISSACVRNIRRAMSLQEPSRSSRTV